MFAPRVYLASNNLVGLGSVLSRSYEQENTVITGNKAKVIKSNYKLARKLGLKSL